MPKHKLRKAEREIKEDLKLIDKRVKKHEIVTIGSFFVSMLGFLFLELRIPVNTLMLEIFGLLVLPLVLVAFGIAEHFEQKNTLQFR